MQPVENAVQVLQQERVVVDLQTGYEARLVNPQIKAHIIFVEHNYDTKGFMEIKKKVKIAINAKLESTGEQYNFVTELFLSPMSID